LAEPSNGSGSPEAANLGQSQPAQDEASAAQTRESKQSRSFWKRHRRLLTGMFYGLVVIAFLYYVLPRLIGLGPTLKLLERGDIWWLALGVVLEALSFGGQIVLLRGVFSTPQHRIDWRGCYDISVAGAAATKLFAAAGAGGVALTVWALHGYGLSGAGIADGMVCYYIVTYAVYMFSMAIVGYGLWLGLFSGPAPWALTLVPAVFATVVILIVVSMLWVYEPAERFLERRADKSSGRAAKRWRRAAAWPRALHQGQVAAIGMMKRRDPSLLGALAGWGFDIAVLWTGFRAFGPSPTGAVIVMSYWVGTMGNLLPLPGGIGGVEGGMIGSFLGFGVQRQLAVLAVLAYRTISYWLPTIPGAVSYWQLRRRFHGSPNRTDEQTAPGTTR
jgi:putative heme transporter